MGTRLILPEILGSLKSVLPQWFCQLAVQLLCGMLRINVQLATQHQENNATTYAYAIGRGTHFRC